MTQDKKDFIETMLTWFRSPQVGNDEEFDRKFLASAYDNITQPHWISVEDELPPKDKAYLAYWQHNGVTKYRYVKAGTKVSRTFSEHITHWMPLPQAPLVTDLNKKDLPPVSWQEGNILVEEEGGEKMDFFTWKERYEYYRTKGYEQGYEDAINKACDWLEKKAYLYVRKNCEQGEHGIHKTMLEDFRKAMKGGEE